MNDRNPIERLYLLDLDVVLHDNETIYAVLTELTTGLLVEFNVLLEHGPVSGWPVVRFTGPRSQLEKLLDRYNSTSWTPSE